MAEEVEDGTPLPEEHADKKSTSAFRGVSWHERSQRWEVRAA